MPLWTDYPFVELGDTPHTLAPIRLCTLLGYDRDKYCMVEIDGVRLGVKRGYVYTKPGRCGEVNAITHKGACRRTR